MKVKPLQFWYRNYKGDVALRTVIPEKVWYGETIYHPGKQWFMTAFCHDREERRDFALRDCIFHLSSLKDTSSNNTAS